MTIKKFFIYRNSNRYTDSRLFVTVQEIKPDENLAIVEKVYYPNHELLPFFKGNNNQNINVYKLPKSYHTIQQLPLDELCKIYGADNNKGIEEINEVITNKVIYRASDKYRAEDKHTKQELLSIVSKLHIERAKVTNCLSAGYNLDDGRYKINVYNVGQACCSALIKDKSVHTVFDLGSTKYSNHSLNYLLHKGIRDSKYEKVNIIISHYHDDHLNMVKYIDFRESINKKVKFILPYPTTGLEKLSTSTLLLLVAIYKNNCDNVFLSLEKDDVYQEGVLNVYQGNGYRGKNNDSTFINNKSLIVDIHFKKDSLLVPGDAIYDAWPKSFNVTHLIIPHHGCKYGKDLDEFPNIGIHGVEKAIVYAGPDKRYGHPDINHIGKYNEVYRFYKRKPKENRKIFDNGKRVRDCCKRIRKDKKSFSLH